MNPIEKLRLNLYEKYEECLLNYKITKESFMYLMNINNFELGTITKAKFANITLKRYVKIRIILDNPSSTRHQVDLKTQIALENLSNNVLMTFSKSGCNDRMLAETLNVSLNRSQAIIRNGFRSLSFENLAMIHVMLNLPFKLDLKSTKKNGDQPSEYVYQEVKYSGLDKQNIAYALSISTVQAEEMLKNRFSKTNVIDMLKLMKYVGSLN